MGKRHINKMAARLDFIQSATGLILGLFIMAHLLFEASILISNDLMRQVTLMFEGYYFFGERYPGIISFLAAAIGTIIVVHAATAMRKFPSSYKQYKIMKAHTKRMDHEESWLWIVQVVTGFAMFFLASVHVYTMLVQPENIGPYASAYRVYNERVSILYFFLLVSVVSHAFIGLYRLALKWGFFEGNNTKKSRKKLNRLMKVFIVAYLVVGFASLAKYIYIGATHDLTKEQHYIPAGMQEEKR